MKAYAYVKILFLYATNATWSKCQYTKYVIKVFAAF